LRAGAASGLPTHKKSYQLGVLATPVQIRTDPLSSLAGYNSARQGCVGPESTSWSQPLSTPPTHSAVPTDLGRFTSRDPIGMGDYAYAGNNPIS